MDTKLASGFFLERAAKGGNKTPRQAILVWTAFWRREGPLATR
jgi:hypothetical protein